MTADEMRWCIQPLMSLASIVLLAAAGCSMAKGDGSLSSGAMLVESSVTRIVYDDAGDRIRSYSLDSSSGMIRLVFDESGSFSDEIAAIREGEDPLPLAYALAEADGIDPKAISDDVAIPRCIERTYDESGGLISQTEYDEGRNSAFDITSKYDGLGHVILEIKADPETGEVAYSTAFSYDELGNLATKSTTNEQHETQITTYSRDGNGNEIGYVTTDEAGAVIDEERADYDESGRLMRRTRLRNDGSAQCSYEYSYREDGKLESVDTIDYSTVFDDDKPAKYHTDYVYDSHGYLVEETYSSNMGDRVEGRRQYENNGGGQVIRECLVSGAINELTTYSYDEQGRLFEIGFGVDVHADEWLAVRPY